MLTTISISAVTIFSGPIALHASSASKTLTAVLLLPCGNAMTGHIETFVPCKYFFANGMAYGLMQAVATLYLSERFRPSSRIWSVMVGCRREWSIILARMGRETLTLVDGFEDAMLAVVPGTGSRDSMLWSEMCTIAYGRKRRMPT